MSDSEPRFKTHKNKERIVKCPYCDTETPSRGLYQHVWRSGDDAHSGHKNLPETWEEDKENLEEVGQKDVTLHVPSHKEYDHERLLCKHCGEDFKGTHGLSVHLSRTSDSLHPEDSDVQSAGLRVPVGPDDAVVVENEMLEDLDGHNIDPSKFSDKSVLDGSSKPDSPSSGSGAAVPDGYVPIPDLVELIGYYERQGKTEAAEELRGLIKKYA